MKKKYTYYIIAAALALPMLSGCSNSLEVDAPDASTLRAVIESGKTRVDFDSTVGKFEWTDGDEIAVYIGSAFETTQVEPETGVFSLTGVGERSFYGVYPASSAVANTETLQVTLPATYDAENYDFDDPAFSPTLMVAENKPEQDDLYFLHVGGLVRIHCKGVASTTTAKVIFDKDVTGTYTVDTSNMENPTITTAGNATNNTVTYSVGGKTDFVLNVPVPCGTYTTISLQLDDAAAVKLNDSDLTFARHHGKQLAYGDYTFTYKIEGLHDVTTEALGGTKELAQAFYSYKTDGTVKVVVPFVFEFSTDEGATWSETAPEWLSLVEGTDMSGSTTGQMLKVMVTPQEDTAEDTHAAILQAKDEVEDVDLSKVNVAGEATARNTANTYVVRNPGTYRIPMVYGNGIKDGAVNTNAFYATNGYGGSHRTEDVKVEDSYSYSYGWLNRFKDHLDKDIQSPYIPEQLSASSSTFSAVLVWVDSEGLVTNVAYEAGSTSDYTDDYITFEVPKSTICQGNALVAVLDQDGKIAWSWQIWVTDDDLNPVTVSGIGAFLPVPVGWEDPMFLERYLPRTCYVRAKQTPDGGAVSDAVSVVSNKGSIVYKGGNATFYNWGRKDPLLSVYFVTEGNISDSPSPQTKKYIYTSPYSFIRYLEGITTVGNAIQTPTTIYSWRKPAIHYAWCDYTWINAWDASAADGVFNDAAIAVTQTTKSIYDPSPAGFKVPPFSVYDSFNDSNLLATVKDNMYTRKIGDLYVPEIPLTGIKNALSRYWSSTMDNIANGFISNQYLYYTRDYVFTRTVGHTNYTLPVLPVQE